jgi:hypothetical protein
VPALPGRRTCCWTVFVLLHYFHSGAEVVEFNFPDSEPREFPWAV